jgi:aspartate/methionine/tyrosine aminotransferase
MSEADLTGANQLFNRYRREQMMIAERVARLGTETAFLVSAEAAAYAAQGNKVYPFHLGDMNLKTPSNVLEAGIKAMRDGHTNYSMENVAIQPGGKPTIGKFFLTMMNPGDEVLYPNPGYPIYESMIEFHGGKAVPYGYIEGPDNFDIDTDMLAQLITPRTKLLVLNDLQNPTGAECSKQELETIAELVLKHDLYVLCDEAYFDIRYGGQSQSLVSLPGMQERCVILHTFSKKFAMTGWRLGASIGPREIIDVIIKLNVNEESCSNHFVQYAAIEGLTGDQTETLQLLDTLKERRDTVVDILNGIDGIRCIRPNATFYLWPNVTGAMQKTELTDYNDFRQTVLKETGVSFCTRLHFGRPLEGEDNNYIRMAYSGIDIPEMKEGLARFKKFIMG